MKNNKQSISIVTRKKIEQIHGIFILLEFNDVLKYNPLKT